MLYTHYLISVDNRVPYRELGSNIQDESLTAFITDHFSHFCENDDFSKEQFAVYTTQKEMVIGCIHQLYLREKNRYFYLNHTYCADLSEREKILANLPNLIATTEFDSVPKQNPDLSLTSIPHREDDIITLTYPKEVLKQLVQASMDALLDNGKKHLFIISGWEDCFDLKARDLMSQIVSLLPYQCRRKLNFCSYANDITHCEDACSIIFCRPQDAVAFQQKYGEESCFYFLQQQLAFPQITVRPFADYAVEHSDEIMDLLVYADRKLTGKLKNDPEFYDVLCHVRHIEKDESLENYTEHRAHLISNLSQLYQLGVVPRKKALQLLENELHFEPDDADVPFETKLSAFLYCYETGMVSKELMHAFLLHIRSCTDPIKWQLLCKQLQIDMTEEELHPQENEQNADVTAVLQVPEDTEEVIEETEDEDTETVEILIQPDIFEEPQVEEAVAPVSDAAEEPQAETEPTEPENETAVLIEEAAKESEEAFAAIDDAEEVTEDTVEEETIEEAVEEEKPTMLPRETLDPFVDNLMQSSNIVRYINAGCLYYNKPLYQEFYVQRAVAKYLSAAVNACNTYEELQMVEKVADQIAEYKVEAMVIIAEEIHRMVFEREELIRDRIARREAEEKRNREQAMLAAFDVIFHSSDISKLEEIPMIPQCIEQGIDHATIEEYALKQYRENKNTMALLFLCCQYDVKGKLQDCEIEKIDTYLHANIRAKELKYEWLNEVAALPGIEKHPIFNTAICQYVIEDTEILEDARIGHDALYFFLVENGIIRSSSKKYLVFGGVVVAAIVVVTAAGVLLTSFGILG